MILYIYPLFENQVFAVGKIACADSDDKKQVSKAAWTGPKWTGTRPKWTGTKPTGTRHNHNGTRGARTGVPEGNRQTKKN
jgi:hypothetical protein